MGRDAPRLSELVADYKLVADLAVTYGRIEELRWRLRYRSENLPMHDLIDGMTMPLVTELRNEVRDLIDRVVGQIEEPDVQPIGLRKVILTGGVASSATLGIRVNRRSASASSSDSGF